MNLYPIKVQFFLSYGALGSIGPLMALILKESKDFSPRQIALTLSLSSLGMLFTPAFMTYLADKSVDTRKILRWSFAVTTFSLISLYYLINPIQITLAWTLYSVAFVPVLPLLDGYFFNYKRSMELKGYPCVEYNKIRIWGSIGFIAPSCILFFILSGNKSIANSLWCAVLFCFLSYVFTFFMDNNSSQEKSSTKKPTRESFKVLLSPSMIPFCIGIFLAYTAANCYFPYLSVFFKEHIGIKNNLITVITSVGVAIEIIYISNLNFIRKFISIRAITAIGLGSMAIRLALLATFPELEVAILIQIFHGLEILSMFVLPIMYLDQVAGPGFRNSIQGAFTILITVPSRLVGFLLAGEIARAMGSKEVLYVSSILCAMGMIAISVFFKEKTRSSSH